MRRLGFDESLIRRQSPWYDPNIITYSDPPHHLHQSSRFSVLVEKSRVETQFEGFHLLRRRETRRRDRYDGFGRFGSRNVGFYSVKSMLVVNLPHFIEKIDFGPPPRSASFLVPLLRFFDENDVFGVLAISHQKSILIHRDDEKSTFRRKIKFPEAISLEPVQSRSTFWPHFVPPKGVEKWSATAQARVKLLLGI